MATAILTKTGFGIRKFMTKKRPDEIDDEDYDFKDIGLPAPKDNGRVSRLSRRPSPSRPADLQLAPLHAVAASPSPRRQHFSTVSPRLPDTPHSSTSSLCSCDESHAADHHTRSRVSSLSNASTSKTRSATPDSIASISTRQSGSTIRTSSHSTAFRTDEMNLLSCRSKTKEGEPSSRLATTSTTLSPPSRNGSPRFPDRKESRRDWSESTQSFMRETDEAFKAVGDVLDKVMIAASPTRPSLEAAHEHTSTETIKPTSPKKPEICNSVDSARPCIKRRPSKVSNPDDHLKSPTRTSSVKKSKRKNPQRRKVGIVSKRGSRWALPDNVTEFLNEHWVYPRIEADEMLPPSRLEEIRRSKISRLEVADSLDIPKQSETDDSETPIDAFHLQDLPSRIGAAGVRLSTISESMPTPPRRPDPPAPILWVSPDGAVTRRDFSAPLLIRREQPPPRPAKDNDLKFKDLSFPAPPAKNPARALRQKQAQMPTIEEMIAGPSKPLPVPKPKTNPTPKPEDKEKAKATKPKVAKPQKRIEPTRSDYVYFKSTPYSLTMPTFEHGPIRFTKATLGLEPQLPPDELLDWTSFQMAILGDAGDVFAESDEFTTRRRSEGEDTDDLASWLASHGVSGCGSLVTHRTGRNASNPPGLVSSSSSKSNSAAPSPASEKSDAPIPVDTEHPNGYWNEASVDATRLVQHHLGMRSCSVKRWTVEGHPKRPAGSKSFGGASGFPQEKKRRESLDSLPQSPMLDLVQSRDYTGKMYTVPMGYNLGHDLGDYLAWESNQMFAGQDEAELP